MKKIKLKYNIFDSEMSFECDYLSVLLSQLEIVEEYNKQLDLYKQQKKLGIHVSIDGHGADEFLGMIGDIPQLSLEYYNNLVDLNNINGRIVLMNSLYQNFNLSPPKDQYFKKAFFILLLKHNLRWR